MTSRRRIVLTGAGIAAMLAIALALVVRDRASNATSAGVSADAGSATCTALWAEGIELAGTVDGRASGAYFDLAPVVSEPPQVSGIVLFPRERSGTVLADTPIGLAGPLRDDGCSVELTVRDSHTDDSIWSLRIESRTHVNGRRQRPDGREETIAFTIVPETPCDGAGEWRTFRSPDWPITFDYPAAWVITADHDDITVECPSVTRLAHGGAWLVFEQGRFAPESATKQRAPLSRVESAGADDERFTDPFWFSRYGEDDWRVNAGACNQDASTPVAPRCPPARRSERPGLTILQGAAGEHRLYRPGVGYLGPGGGITRYLFIVDDRWVSLDAAGVHAHGDDIGHEGGPVLLEGDGVGDRLVRSIRRR